MKIGIFGGTFNPPHIGHFQAAREFISALSLDTLYYVPTNIPPHKKLPIGSPNAEQRLEMVQLMARELPQTAACDIELRREGASYTFETAEEMKKAYPNEELWLLMGTDMLESFEHWREPERITACMGLAAAARHADDEKKLLLAADKLRDTLGARVKIIKNRVYDISSTQVRNDSIGEQLLPAVAEYIKEHCLYLDFESIERQVAACMSAKRFEHVMGCQKLALELAESNGADKNVVRLAALLHDITKEMPFEEQLNLCTSRGIITNYDGVTLQNLIHALSGAVIAREEFGAPETVARAIARHTTGGDGMTLIDKIIFGADMAAYGRSYDGVLGLRALMLESLDSGVLEALLRTEAHTAQMGWEAAPETLAGIEYMKKICTK